MKISVFGLGYVGCVTAACLATRGAQVIGVDVNQTKVDAINSGRSPIVEPGIDHLISAAVSIGALVATDDPVKAVTESDISFLCVGTPVKPNGSLDLTYIKRACQQIGGALQNKHQVSNLAICSPVA